MSLERAAEDAANALREALDSARNGLKWYQDQYQPAASPVDQEMLDTIDRAISAYDAATNPHAPAEQKEFFFNHPLRFEAIIYLPATFIDEEVVPDIAREFLDDLPDDTGKAIYRDLPELVPFADNEDPPVWHVVERLSGLDGFLVKAATPVKQAFGTHGACEFSWGYFHTQWVYGATWAEAVAKAIAWAEQMQAQDLPANPKAEG